MNAFLPLAAFSAVVTVEKPVTIDFGPEGEGGSADTAIAGIQSRNILGVVPTKPGWSEFKSDRWPPKSVTWARGAVPMPRGLISVEWKREGGRIVEKLTVPEGLVRFPAPGELENLRRGA